MTRRGGSPRDDACVPKGTAAGHCPGNRWGSNLSGEGMRFRRNRPAGISPSREEPLPGSFRRDLASWYTRCKRDLPWRRTRDPYAVWVSEVMLQQTRVEVVTPRYRQFLSRFPAVADLAAAGEEEVLAHWSGLGYYRRARDLRRGAAVVAGLHGGRFPTDLEAARAIPGVGPYTAAAILSIAYDLPYAVVDGNVARVLARIHRLEPPRDGNASELRRRAQRLLDPARAGDHNQAMMELGATVCLPRRPLCGSCPVARHCVAFAGGDPEAYPRPRSRPPTIERSPILYLLRDRHGRLLLCLGGWDLLRHLWLPPIADPLSAAIGPAAERSAHPEMALPGRMVEQLDISALRSIGAFRHSITRHRIRFEVQAGPLPLGRGRLPRGFRLVADDGLTRLGRSSILDKALRVETRSGMR